MKSMILSTILFLFSGNVFAEGIYCSFNAVKLSISYQSDTNMVTIIAPSGEKHELKGSLHFQKNGILKIEAEGLTEYLLVDTNKSFFDPTLKTLYPFEGSVVASSTTLVGGCETDELKKPDKVP